MKLPELSKTLRKFNIERKFWPEMYALVEYGVQPQPALQARLRTDYRRCLNKILADLSKPLLNRFPPSEV